MSSYSPFFNSILRRHEWTPPNMYNLMDWPGTSLRSPCFSTATVFIGNNCLSRGRSTFPPIGAIVCPKLTTPRLKSTSSIVSGAGQRETRYYRSSYGHNRRHGGSSLIFCVLSAQWSSVGPPIVQRRGHHSQAAWREADTGHQMAQRLVSAIYRESNLML